MWGNRVSIASAIVTQFDGGFATGGDPQRDVTRLSRRVTRAATVRAARRLFVGARCVSSERTRARRPLRSRRAFRCECRAASAPGRSISQSALPRARRCSRFGSPQTSESRCSSVARPRAQPTSRKGCRSRAPSRRRRACRGLNGRAEVETKPRRQGPRAAQPAASAAPHRGRAPDALFSWRHRSRSYGASHGLTLGVKGLEVNNLLPAVLSTRSA